MDQYFWITVSYLWLPLLGLVIGAFGTFIGAGGGFLLVPILLLLYPNESPEVITSVSLIVVFFSATSGSLAYARMKRIDYKSALLFSIATFPGAILGALTTTYFERQLFDLIFAILMITASVYLLVFPEGGVQTTSELPEPSKFNASRSLVDSSGARYSFSFNLMVGAGLSLVVGYLSSVLGVGGGFIHVPILVRLLNFPVHVATATSQFVLAVMALAGSAVHIAIGTFSHGVQRTLILGIGVIVGAQLGAILSSRVQGNWIIRALATALALVGVRILLLAVW
jgi:uncharacterized membrane protein YfcA